MPLANDCQANKVTKFLGDAHGVRDAPMERRRDSSCRLLYALLLMMVRNLRAAAAVAAHAHSDARSDY